MNDETTERQCATCARVTTHERGRCLRCRELDMEAERLARAEEVRSRANGMVVRANKARYRKRNIVMLVVALIVGIPLTVAVYRPDVVRDIADRFSSREGVSTYEPTSEATAYTAAIEGLAGKMCDCPSLECAVAVFGSYSDLLAEKPHIGSGKRDRVESATRRLNECYLAAHKR